MMDWLDYNFLRNDFIPALLINYIDQLYLVTNTKVRDRPMGANQIKDLQSFTSVLNRSG
jgi:hypothetical protein